MSINRNRRQLLGLNVSASTALTRRGYTQKTRAGQHRVPPQSTSNVPSEFATLSALEDQQAQDYGLDEKQPMNTPSSSASRSSAMTALPTLRIAPPKFPHKAQNPGAEYVGKAPFRQAYVGPSGTGKSVLLNHMMNNFFGRYFKHIYVLSPTFSTDPSFMPRNWEATQVFSHWDPSILRNIYRLQKQAYTEKHGRTTKKRKNAKSQRSRNKRSRATKIRLREEAAQRNSWSHTLEYHEPRSQYDEAASDEDKSTDDSEAATDLHQEPTGEPTLVIVDDFSHEPEMLSDPSITNIAFSGRHFNISMIVLTQKYSKLSTAYRANITEIAMFRPNGNEGEAFIDDHGSLLVKRSEFRRMFAWAVSSNRHNFLWVMKQVEDMHKAYRVGLDKIIRIPFEPLTGEEKKTMREPEGSSNETPSASREASVSKRTEAVNSESRGSDPLYKQITQPDFQELDS